MWENRDSAQVDGLSGYHDLGYHHSDECSIAFPDELFAYLSRAWNGAPPSTAVGSGVGERIVTRHCSSINGRFPHVVS